MCTQVERRLDCDVRAVPEARRAVAEVFDEVGLTRQAVIDTRYDALLVATEMLANAARACRHYLSVRVQVHRHWLEIEVTDDSPAPPVRSQAGPHATHGRGVEIIDTLSDDWGFKPWNGSSKSVWSRLKLPPEEVLSITCSAD